MIYMFLSNSPSSGDINSSNLSCFPSKHQDAGANEEILERGFICLKYVGFAWWILSFILNTP